MGLSPEEILSGLSAIASDWRLLAVLWHGYFLILVLTLVYGVRPTRRVAGFFLALPVASVSVLAWLNGNPFNGASFALITVVLVAIATRWSRLRVKVAPIQLAVPGVLLVLFGWIYPHFVEDARPFEYLYAAPTGLIPCPTLSIVIGFTLVLGGLGSRSWCLVLAAAGLFYGVFGAVRLGVRIDMVLILGAFATAYAAFSPIGPHRFD